MDGTHSRALRIKQRTKTAPTTQFPLFALHLTSVILMCDDIAHSDHCIYLDKRSACDIRLHFSLTEFTYRSVDTVLALDVLDVSLDLLTEQLDSLLVLSTLCTVLWHLGEGLSKI